MDKNVDEEGYNEESDVDVETISGSDSDGEIQAKDDNYLKSSTGTGEVKETPYEARIMLETPIRDEGMVRSHTGARSKKRTPEMVEGEAEMSIGIENVTEECAPAKKKKKKSKNTSTVEYEDDDDDDFTYYNEDWTPDNPFQTGLLIHPDEPFYKQNNMENSEEQQEPKPEEYPTFKQFYEDALAEVMKMNKWISYYFERESNFERARFVLRLSASRALKLPPNRSGKSKEEAEKCAKNFFKLKEADAVKALQAISISIRYTSGNSLKDLAQRYVKRAELLFSLKKYKEAFRDARRSLSTYDKPEDMMWLTYEMLGLCYQEYKLLEKSIYCFKKAVEGMEMSNPKIDQQAQLAERYRTEIKNMKEILEKDKKDNEKRNPEKKKDKQEEKNKKVKSNLITFGIGHKVILPKPTPRTRTRIGDEAKDSPLLYIKYNKASGRGLYASANINPGDILMVEKPYASAIHAHLQDSYCCICFKPVFNPIPCSNCINVWFCGEECMSKSVVRHIHEYECEVLHYLQDPDMERMTLLTYRIITRFPWQKLKQYLPAINTSRNDVAESFEQYNKIDNQLKEVNQKIDAEIFLMKTNGKYREFDDLFKKSMASVYILECLKVGGYFKDDPPTNEQKVKIVSIALKHMQAVNSYAQHVNVYVPLEQNSMGVGFAIHPMISLANHSCVPNAVRYYINNVCVFRATRCIKKNRQIFDCYGPYYDTLPKEQRFNYLAKYYKFECKCEACVRNWPLFKKNFKPLKFRCPEDKCTETIIINFDYGGKICPFHGYESKKVLSLISDVSNGIQFVNNAFINASYRRLDITPLKKFQILLDKLSIPPSKNFSLCQDAFKLIFQEEGNSYKSLGDLLHN